MPSNFNSTTPAAPAGGVNVIFQTDGNGNDSAYLPSSAASPGGLNGDIQYNNNGVFGGSDAQVSAAGSVFIPEGQILEWTSSGGYSPADYTNAAISQLASNTLAFGDGTPGDVSGAAAMTALVLFGSSSYYDYDLFHTTIYSGAEQNWSLILPPNSGTTGQVLTTNGTGVTYWSTVSGGGGGTPGGSTGDIQYNNGGSFGGSLATINAAGSVTIPVAQAIFWGTDTSISRISGGLLAIGQGSIGSETGGIILNTINLGDEFYDNTGYAGANGWVLSSTGTKTLWINPATSLAVPGSIGDILYNNGGVMGAALATITATGSITIPDTQVITWSGAAYSSVGLSQLAADTLAVGNGSESDVSGAMAMTGLILFGSSYYSAYDAFHTTIYSGATQNWNLVLPETAGTNGQVLTNIGSGFTAWESLSVSWSSLTSATANLTLANGTNTTTFNQTSNVAWLWANTTTGTSGSTNASPLLELAANYYTGATTGVDLWTIGSSLAAGTNGASTLTFTHSGTTGTAQIQIPDSPSTVQPGIVKFSGGSTFGCYTSNFVFQSTSGNAGTIRLYNSTTLAGYLTFNTNSSPNGIQLEFVPNNGTLILAGSNTTTANIASVQLGSGGGTNGNGNIATTSGTSVGVQMGGTNSPLVFNPASGTANFYACLIEPTLEGTTSGNTTALYVNPTITTTNLSGTNMIAVFASGGTQEAAIDYSGNYYSGNTKGVTQTAEAVGTLATTGGIVTTFTAVSDERLKIFSPSPYGLDEILAITPIRYRWNEIGRTYSGQSTERDFVGFSAQNVKQVIPEAVWVSKDDYLGFDDRPVIAALVNAVKELKAEIDALKARK